MIRGQTQEQKMVWRQTWSSRQCRSASEGAEEDTALRMAYELYITSTFHEEKMWNRLLVISVEDVGFGDTQAPVFVKTMYDLHKEYPYMDGDRPIFFNAQSATCAGARGAPPTISRISS